MTRFYASSLLALMVTLLSGCGTSHSLGDDPNGPAAQDKTVTAASEKPAPVSAEEKQVIAKLEELGAKVDLDQAGHVRLLELGKSEATDDDLAMLIELPQLESLDITGGKITPAGIQHVTRLTGLQRLYLNDIPVTNKAMESIAKLTKLDVLSLRNTSIDDSGILPLKALKRLRVLNLAKTGISNESLKQIQDLHELDTLVLVDTKVTGEGFQYLKPLKMLRVLNVDHCQGLDGHLMDLSGLTELRMLYTHGCHVSQDEQDELTNVNPMLAVFGD